MTKGAALALFSSFSALGLLLLVKGTMLPQVGLVFVSCSVLLWKAGLKTISAMAASALLFSLLFFWMLSGQSFGSLPDFIAALRNEATHRSHEVLVHRFQDQDDVQILGGPEIHPKPSEPGVARRTTDQHQRLWVCLKPFAEDFNSVDHVSVFQAGLE